MKKSTLEGGQMRYFFLIFLIPIHLLATWAEERLAQMTVEEKVGQLFCMPACPKRGAEHRRFVEKALTEYKIGAVLLKKANPEEQVEMINWMQEISHDPLLCCQDAEWGLAMRMENTVKFPKNMTLGATGDLDLIFKMGKLIGEDQRRVGCRMNFSPVVDVNDNPKNPVIHMRSFGDDPNRVAKCGLAMMKGLWEGGTIPTAKHGLGHGNVSKDSHLTLPFVPHDLDHLKRNEFISFQYLMDRGLLALMTAHLLVLAFDDKLPCGMSPKFVKYIREKMGFPGLIISDALNMRGIADLYSTEEIAVGYSKAGHDMLLYAGSGGRFLDEGGMDQKYLYCEVLPLAYSAVLEAVKDGSIDDIDEKVLRILKLKEKVQLNEDRLTLPPGNLMTEESMALSRELFRKAITVVGDLPLMNESYELFELKEMTTSHKKQYNLSDSRIEEINTKAKEGPIVVAVYGTPYAIKFFSDDVTLIIAYEDNPDTHEAVADLLKGELEATGRLPIKISRYAVQEGRRKLSSAIQIDGKHR